MSVNVIGDRARFPKRLFFREPNFFTKWQSAKTFLENNYSIARHFTFRTEDGIAYSIGVTFEWPFVDSRLHPFHVLKDNFIQVKYAFSIFQNIFLINNFQPPPALFPSMHSQRIAKKHKYFRFPTIRPRLETKDCFGVKTGCLTCRLTVHADNWMPNFFDSIPACMSYLVSERKT
jgi:hypothetical protein